MSWQLLIWVSIVFMSVGVLLQRVVVRSDKNDPVAFSILFQLLVGAMIATYGFFFEDMSFPNLLPLMPNIILMVILWGLANIFNFKALQITEASTFTVIFSSRAFFTTLAVAYFFGEYLNLTQWLGALLIMAGIILVSIDRSNLRISKKEIFSILTALFFGLANTNDRLMLQSFNLFPYISMAFTLPAIGVALYSPKSVVNIPVYLNKTYFRQMILIGIIYSVSSVSFFKALQIAPNASQVANISVSGVLVTVVLSVIFLKERDRLYQKLLGALLGFIGVLLVS